MPFTHPEAGAPLDEMTAKFAAEVVRRHKPGLLLAHFLDYDHRMHYAPWSAQACRSLERIDAWIAHILEAYRSAGILDRTTVFVVSDHGFMEVRKVVSLFAMLLDVGWEELFPGVEVSGAFEVKYAGGSAAFYPGRMTSPALLARVAGRLRPRIENKYRHAVRWISPGHARVLGGFPGAVFTLCAQPGYSVTGLPPSRREVFVDRGEHRASHGYCPDQPEMNGIFIASGFGVRRAGVIGRMALEDVAPTVASFLSVRLPQATGRDLSSRLRAR
jgi:predicted AlkP superfamily pyrophosphatase or phosphodiesterase